MMSLYLIQITVKNFPDNGLMKLKRRMHKSISKQKVAAIKRRKCVMVIDAQISLRKILFWANPVLSGFTSDVKA